MPSGKDFLQSFEPDSDNRQKLHEATLAEQNVRHALEKKGIAPAVTTGRSTSRNLGAPVKVTVKKNA